MCIPRISLGNARRLVTILCDVFTISYPENDYKSFFKIFLWDFEKHGASVGVAAFYFGYLDFDKASTC